MVWDLLIFGF
jgi:hypothetical protein